MCEARGARARCDLNPLGQGRLSINVRFSERPKTLLECSKEQITKIERWGSVESKNGGFNLGRCIPLDW